MRTEHHRGLIGLIGARVVVSTLLLGSGVVFQVSAPGSLPIDPFFFLIGLTYCLSVLYAITLPYVDRHRWLLDGQFACDAITVSAVLHFTGGVTSYFALLYALPIVGAGTLQRRAGGLRVAGLSSLLYGGIVAYQYTGGAGYVSGQWVADIRAFLPPVRVALYIVAANASAFFIVSLLSGSLAERVRHADARAEQASTALADLQAFNEHIVASLTSGLATTDASGRLLTFNPAAERIVRLPAAAVIGRTAADALQLPDAFVRELARPFEPGQGRRADYVFRAPDGREIDVGLAATELVTPDGHRGLLLTFQDVTEMRRLERDSRRRQRLAAVGEMAAGIAHEIRNPLASMRGAIQVLRHELDLSDQQARLMDIVLRESDRLNGTIRSFLAYARPQPPAIAAVDVVKVLRDTATLIAHSSDVRPDHRIRVDVDHDSLLHETDESQLRQVVWNLASNGLRAMPEGGCLTLSAHHEGDGPGVPLLLEVADDGIGMPADQLDRLFEPFRGSFDRGSGLGLAIVHRIVNDFGGEVRIASELGVGTTVTVQLPGSAGASAGAVETAPPLPATGTG